ncbi:MAG TPA: chromate efflux transporter [Fibrobacteria bacterium]|nr:chromate efflux transporter [Fibrobacteria bacterium]
MRAAWESAGLFLKLGCTAFGGPAAHIAMMRREVVERRKWMTEGAFLDLLGATNLIPGPNSTEMAIHIGYLRAGWPGLILSGLAFIVPAMLMVSGMAWLYARSGSLPQTGWLLYGIKPVVTALILQAVWNLGRKSMEGTFGKLCFVAVLTAYFAGVNEIALLLAGGAAALAKGPRRGGFPAARAGLGAAGIAVTGAAAASPTGFSLSLLFLKFLKIGSALYGSGYVLLPFLRSEFAERTGWLSEAQILDAVSVGQFTPGPFFTTATFIGYLLGGMRGGLLATLGIFLPAFVFVAASNPWIPRLRRSRAVGLFLDGVNVASLALMAGAAWQTGKASVVDGTTAALALLALYLLLRRGMPSIPLLAGGGLVGLAVKALVL